MLPPALSGEIKGSFPYLTLKDRLPIIVTKVIDHLCREKVNICKEYGEESSDELKLIVGQLSQLKNELQTNKPFTCFENLQLNGNNKFDDTEIWNSAISFIQNQQKSEIKWFSTSWLFAECYFYKRIDSFFSLSKTFCNYDPFKHQKVRSCQTALKSMKVISDHMLELLQMKNNSENDQKNILHQMVQLSLWGNQYDLSLSAGGDYTAGFGLLTEQDSKKENILISNFDQFWKHLRNLPEDKGSTGIILDNAGLELFADLCLSTILIEYKFTKSVTFYTKTRPWFVSDTTLQDVNWFLQFLREQEGSLSLLSDKFSKYLENGIWKIRESIFWTLPYDYSEMRRRDSDLYEEMKLFSTLIFKGDLNYRKLVGDLDWPTSVSIETALRGFMPTPFLILRTIKGGPVVGLSDRSPEVINAKSKDDWNTSGDFGMIQFVTDKFSFNYWKVSIWVSSFFSIFLISYLLKKLF